MKLLKSIYAWFAGLFIFEESKMNLTAAQITFAVGATTQLTASESVTYASSDTTIMTVDADGLVTGVGIGSATITATSVADVAQTVAFELTVTAVVAAAPLVAAAPAATKATELEKLEALIDKLELETFKEVKAAIAFIKAIA